MYKNMCRIFISLPYILNVCLMIFLSCFIGLSIIWNRAIVQLILLLIVSVCLSLDNKKINIIGIIFIVINFIYNIILSYYDSLINVKMDTFVSDIYLYGAISIYYVVIFLLKNIHFKKRLSNK